MEEPFSKGFPWQMGDNFWEANLLRGCSAWGINDQIIMPRAGEFSLGEQVIAVSTVLYLLRLARAKVQVRVS